MEDQMTCSLNVAIETGRLLEVSEYVPIAAPHIRSPCRRFFTRAVWTRYVEPNAANSKEEAKRVLWILRASVSASRKAPFSSVNLFAVEYWPSADHALTMRTTSDNIILKTASMYWTTGVAITMLPEEDEEYFVHARHRDVSFFVI